MKDIKTSVDFAKEYYPKAWRQINIAWNNYRKAKKIDLKDLKGKKVKTHRAGFGGRGGEILTVKKVLKDYIVLEDYKNDEYLSEIDKWFLDFEIVEDEND